MLKLNFIEKNKKYINLLLTNKNISCNILEDVTRTSPLKEVLPY